MFLMADSVFSILSFLFEVVLHPMLVIVPVFVLIYHVIMLLVP